MPQLHPDAVDPGAGFIGTCYGQPIPQGSKSVAVRGGKAVMFDDNPALEKWRNDMAIRFTAIRNGAPTIVGPVRVVAAFAVRRPPSIPRNREHPAVKPDLDKLVRALFDSLSTAQVWTDDSRVISMQAWKQYPAEDSYYGLATPGVHVRVYPMSS